MRRWTDQQPQIAPPQQVNAAALGSRPPNADYRKKAAISGGPRIVPPQDAGDPSLSDRARRRPPQFVSPPQFSAGIGQLPRMMPYTSTPNRPQMMPPQQMPSQQMPPQMAPPQQSSWDWNIMPTIQPMPFSPWGGFGGFNGMNSMFGRGLGMLGGFNPYQL